MDAVNNTLSERIWQRMLRPIVSLLIKNGLSYRRFCILCKDLFVDVAASEYGKSGRPTNITRISMLTGIDRKDVKRVRDLQKENTNDTQIQNVSNLRSSALGRLLSGWFQDPDFMHNGEPKALDPHIEFAELCRRYGGDLTRTAILAELSRVNAVSSQKNGRIVANSRYYMPDRADSKAVERSCDVYHDIGNTLVHNLYHPKQASSHFEGRVSNTQIPSCAVDDFKQFVEQRGQAFLEEIDACLTSYEHMESADDDNIRVGLGLYWIEEEKNNETR